MSRYSSATVTGSSNKVLYDCAIGGSGDTALGMGAKNLIFRFTLWMDKRVTVGNMTGAVCSRRNISVIESLSVGRKEKDAIVFCLGGYCHLEAQAVVLAAIELPDSALSGLSVETTIAAMLDIIVWFLLFLDVRDLGGRYLSMRQVKRSLSLRLYEMIHFYPVTKVSIKARSWPHDWRAVTSGA
ncbi:hypothetical protein An04g07850 [Aspergillus niger]|uniref:Uncharacterized protein n=2 Tax=Aspergillus niger TaxID=5061 RepID=A2QJQ1_ASPNC|nr:hypothetical protein An04g07850 [Aspergillus niger]CAK44766.1 hypothetical protein An04g07850 [Aspergillus niger]